MLFGFHEYESGPEWLERWAIDDDDDLETNLPATAEAQWF